MNKSQKEYLKYKETLEKAYKSLIEFKIAMLKKKGYTLKEIQEYIKKEQEEFSNYEY